MKQEKKMWQVAAIVTGLILITVVACLVFSGGSREKLPDLPEITIVDLRGDSAQFETFMVYEISELTDANPWTEETELTTLPVYKSQEFNEEASQKTDAESVQNITIPEDVDYPLESSVEEVRAMAEYIEGNHSDLIDMENPLTDVYGGGYNMFNQQYYDIEMYESGAGMEEQILNYNFNRASIVRNEEEESLLSVKRYKADLSEKVGDYPLISVEEATRLLKKGNYKTTLLYEMPGEEYIGKVELVYRTGALVEYYIPYYCFYVELPDMAGADGLKTFGTYYVPAINKEYITNMPKWEPGLIP